MRDDYMWDIPFVPINSASVGSGLRSGLFESIEGFIFPLDDFGYFSEEPDAIKHRRHRNRMNNSEISNNSKHMQVSSVIVTVQAKTKTLNEYIREIKSMLPRVPAHQNSKNHSFDYIEKISDMMTRLNDFKINAEDEHFNNVYNDLITNTEEYFKIDVAIDAMRQNGMRYKNNEVVKSLDVVDFLYCCDFIKKSERHLSRLHDIVETYNSKNKWREKGSGYDIFKVEKKIVALQNKSKELLKVGYRLNEFASK